MLRDARPEPGILLTEPKAAEERRVAAIQELLKIHRRQIAAYRANGNADPGVVNPEIELLFRQLANHVWASENPVAELRLLLLGKRFKGRPSMDRAATFRTVASVRERVRSGETVEQACLSVSEDHEFVGVTEPYARKLYFKYKDSPDFIAYMAGLSPIAAWWPSSREKVAASDIESP